MTTDELSYSNKYERYSDRKLLREYEYLVPHAGRDPAEQPRLDATVEMPRTDLMHMLMLMDAMAARIKQ